MKPVKIAMIGVGAISGIYLTNITEMFSEIELAGVCDLIPERAQEAKEKYNVPKVYATMHEAFADPDVDIVLNLTRPYEHFEVTKAALEAGKHVYSEKPLAATWEEGKELAALAEQKGLMLGGAPDTYLGAGIQTCRKLIDDGFIGDVVGAAAFMICRGHESWHPDPEFYYQKGGGPMMDMGPYYVTALVNLLGGVSGVTGVTKASFAQRMITSQPKRGKIVDVEAPTFVTGILDFESGATGTIFTTFDVYYKDSARLEVYGSKGTLLVPDPNGFGGPVQLLHQEDRVFKEIPLLFDYNVNSRALGLADMAKAFATKREARASHKQTLHVLEVLTAFERSSEKRAYLPLETKFTRAQPMKNNPIHGVLD
jgi:predicted dehydrogenase